MTYELAKQLKDAGFPFNWTNAYGIDWTAGCTYHGTGAVRDIDMCICRKPSLSQLIAACGDKSMGLERNIGGLWRAYYDTQMTDPVNGWQIASDWLSTPEEAVVKLWLALHPSP